MELRTAYNPNYFSIDNILASQTHISCRTEVTIPNFGFLAHECESTDLPMGVNIQLPLWAARMMCVPRRTYVSVSIPSGLRNAYREVVAEGNAVATDLRKIHYQYFEVGRLCTSLFHQDVGDLAEMIPDVLLQRILCIGGAAIPFQKQYCFKIRKEYSSEPIPAELMDLLERQIYQDTVDRSKSILEWMEPILSFGTLPDDISAHFEDLLLSNNYQMMP